MGILSSKSVFVFDWDGTILDSMPTKLRTFSETLAELLAGHVKLPASERVQRVATTYQQLSGIPRRQIFSAALTELNVEPEAIAFDIFDAALRERNQRELLDARIFPDSEAFLSRLQSTPHRLYISSSVPQGELEFLTSRRLPAAVARRLSGVFGSDGVFTKGVGHITRILGETAAPAAELIFFGDDRADAELAETAGVECIVIDRHQRYSPPPRCVGCVPSFASLMGELADG